MGRKVHYFSTGFLGKGAHSFGVPVQVHGSLNGVERTLEPRTNLDTAGGSFGDGTLFIGHSHRIPNK